MFWSNCTVFARHSWTRATGRLAPPLLAIRGLAPRVASLPPLLAPSCAPYLCFAHNNRNVVPAPLFRIPRKGNPRKVAVALKVLRTFYGNFKCMRAPNCHPLRASPLRIFRANAENCQFVTMRNDGQMPLVLPLPALARFVCPSAVAPARSPRLPPCRATGVGNLRSKSSPLFARSPQVPFRATLQKSPLFARPPLPANSPRLAPVGFHYSVALCGGSVAPLRRAGVSSRQGALPPCLAFVSRLFPALQPPNPPFQGGLFVPPFCIVPLFISFARSPQVPVSGNLAKFISKRCFANTGNQVFFYVVYITPFFRIKS